MTTHNPTTDENTLREVKLAFLAALDAGEAPAAWLARYPQHARALTDLALAATAAANPPASLVARATEIARAALLTHHAPSAAEPTLAERVTQLGLTMRDLATRVRLNSEILFKIDRRIIPLDTVPARLLDQLATQLNCTVEALRAGLVGTAPQTAGAMYHASRPPTVGQQFFADAVQASLTLAPADRAYWLNEE